MNFAGQFFPFPTSTKASSGKNSHPTQDINSLSRVSPEPKKISGTVSITKSSLQSKLQQTMEENFEKLWPCSVLPPQRKLDEGKLTVVLDIDETLIHARLPDDIYRQMEDRQDISRSSSFHGETFDISIRPGENFTVNKRPGLDEFLRIASEKYELIAYTAAVEEYAKPLIDKLDPENKYFRHRLYRTHCISTNGHYVKDLRFVNRRLNRVVLVDNNAYCFLPQLENGVPISSFYSDHTDSALEILQRFLTTLDQEKQVQPILREMFNLEKILRHDREFVLNGHPHFS